MLEHSNIRGAVAALAEDERMTVSNPYSHSGTRGGAQSYTLISESGLYALIFRSRKPEAQAFRRWVTKEVMPAIRRTGAYSVAEPMRIEPLDPFKEKVSDLVDDLGKCRKLVLDGSMGSESAEIISALCQITLRAIETLQGNASPALRGKGEAPIAALDRMMGKSLSEAMLRVLYCVCSTLKGSCRMQLKEFWSAARTIHLLGDCEKWDRPTSCAVGRRLTKWIGYPFQDRQGRTCFMHRHKTKKGVVYVFNIAPEAAAA